MSAKDNFHQRLALTISEKSESFSNLILNTIDLFNERIYFFMPIKKFSFLILEPSYVEKSKISGSPTAG